MAHKQEGTLDRRYARHPYNTFFVRYPDAMSWLDGSVWVLDVEDELKESVASFRASMRYQARIYKQKLITRTQWRVQDGKTRQMLLIQAIQDV